MRYRGPAGGAAGFIGRQLRAAAAPKSGYAVLKTVNSVLELRQAGERREEWRDDCFTVERFRPSRAWTVIPVPIRPACGPA